MIAMMPSVFSLDAALYTVRLAASLLDTTKFGKSAMPNRKTSAAIVHDDETNAYPGLLRWIARGMFAIASTLSTTMIHAAGHRSKLVVACGTSHNVSAVTSA